ncbi:MAG: VCBS repeat-containing protein [Propionibacteriales bacterium]|nr:VCBS repeat-containing protein [Propionibacteriales bacterium]
MTAVVRSAEPRRQGINVDLALLLGLMFVLVSLVNGGRASAATTAATFARADYAFLGNTHVVGDFNGDGSLDLAGSGATSAAVQLNNGSGAFGPRLEYPVASWAQDLAPGDFTGDGKLDLVVTINDPQVGLSLLKGNGDGTFAAPVNFANTSGFDSPAVVAVDLNNDAKLDVVVAHQIACYTAPCIVTELMSVLIGNGDGTFQPTRDFTVGRGMSKIAVGDFNRDGINDLAVAGDSSRLYRLYGVGDGTFVQQPTLTLTADTLGVDATDVDVADFNGDTIQDLVVAVALNGSRTAILIGNADGSFRPPSIITEPNLDVPQYQAVADYNGDGFQDLALSLGDGTRGLMEIRNGNGDGTFQPLVHFLTPAPKSSIAGYSIVSANLNGDSSPDITLGISGASPAFAVLLNSTGATPPATPVAPSLLSPAQDATPAQPVSFDWADVSAAASYRIQIDDSNTFSTPIVVDRTVTPSQFTAPTLVARQHWWRVRGINSAGTAGPWSTVRRFTPRATSTAPALSAITLNPSTVVGGSGSQATATLTSPAPTGGAVVTVSSSSTKATVPTSVTIAAGATTATFGIGTSSVTSSTPATISGTYAGVTRSATLTVTPPQTTALLTVTATGRTGERVTSSPAGINVSVGSTASASFPTTTAITLSVTNSRDAIWSGACSSGGNKARTCTFTLNTNATVTANVQ